MEWCLGLVFGRVLQMVVYERVQGEVSLQGKGTKTAEYSLSVCHYMSSASPLDGVWEKRIIIGKSCSVQVEYIYST
jgi:hypothetical protein